MDDRALWELEMRRVFLSETDAPCPRCNYNLRGSPGDKCPECSTPLQLSITPVVKPSRWELVASIAIVVSTVYFFTMAIYQGASALSSAMAGPSLLPIRIYSLLSAATDLVMALVAGGWCLAILALRSRRSPPTWAHPTSAASGILLGTFIVYLLLHTARVLFF
jgi:hypothetical protein